MERGFFQVITPAEFISLLREFSPLEADQKTETAPLEACLGRVLAKEIAATEDLPLAHRSCMDGYAVRAADVFGAGESNPAYLECMAHLSVDAQPNFELPPGHCAGIATGGVLPPGADAVVMVEQTHHMGDRVAGGSGTIEIRGSAAPGQHVMRQGEDVAQDETVLQAGVRLRAPEIGLLAALGRTRLHVYKQPRVAILSTGDEVVAIEATPRPGQMRDVNSHTICCLAHEAEALPRRLGLVKDDLPALTTALISALSESDIVFLSGGSSVGRRDLTIQALESLPDTHILAHGVALSPGKPTILARVNGKAVIGLPGQVASAQIVMLVLGCPFLRHLGGEAAAFDLSRRPTRSAELALNVASKPGREDYIRVTLAEQPGLPPLATPKTGKSGLLRTLVNTHGLVRIPADSEGLEQGALVDVWLL